MYIVIELSITRGLVLTCDITFGKGITRWQFVDGIYALIYVLLYTEY